MRSMVLQRFGNNSRAVLTIKVLRASFNTFFLQKQTASLCTTPEVTSPLTGGNTLPPHTQAHLRMYIPHHSHPALPIHRTQYVVHPAYISCLTCGLAEVPMEAEALFSPNSKCAGHEVAPCLAAPQLSNTRTLSSLTCLHFSAWMRSLGTQCSGQEQCSVTMGKATYTVKISNSLPVCQSLHKLHFSSLVLATQFPNRDEFCVIGLCTPVEPPPSFFNCWAISNKFGRDVLFSDMYY